MKLTAPKNCGECCYAKWVFDNPVCTNPAFPEEWKRRDIRSFRVDLEKTPEWCPYILTNKLLGEMPKGKQDAVSDMINGFRVLLGWGKEVTGDG